MIRARIISILIGYAFGTFVSGFLFGKAHDVDLRQEGSKNIGTTNTLRVLGKKAGAITLVGDALKAILAVVVVWLIFRNSQPEHIELLKLYAAFGAILGHDFPVFLKFKGGKGIACSFGMIVALFPQFLPVEFALFGIAVGITKYVSLGSILCACGLLVQTIIFGMNGMLKFAETDLLEAYIIITIISVLAIFLHRSNIKRLVTGTENKLSFKSQRG